MSQARTGLKQHSHCSSTSRHNFPLRDLVPFVKNMKKHPWRTVTFSKVAG